MLILIIILLLVIIFILCPAILGNLLAGVAIVVGNLAKGIIPLSICFVFYLLLFLFDKIAKKNNRLSEKTIKCIGVGKSVISLVVGMALAIIMNYAGLYFPSYVILFTSLIYPPLLYLKTVKLPEKENRKLLSVIWSIVLMFIAIVFMYELSFFLSFDFLGLHHNNYNLYQCLGEREMPSEVTALITLIGFPFLLCYLLYAVAKGFINVGKKGEEVRGFMITLAPILVGLIIGYVLYECYPYIMPFFKY